MTKTSQTFGCVVGIGMMVLAPAVYGLSIYQAYQSGGSWGIIAIPIVGQLIWFGVRWSHFGFLNSYTYVFLAFGLFGIVFSIFNDAYMAQRQPTPEEIAERDAFFAANKDRMQEIVAKVKAEQPDK
jgi:hypothetical protein